MIPLEPRWMPLINQRLADETRETADRLRPLAERHARLTGYARDLELMAERMHTAELWWAAPDMTALAAHAADDHEGFDGETDARPPAPDGLMVWSGGLPLTVPQPLGMPAMHVAAVHWSTHGDTMRLLLYTADPAMTRLHTDRGLPLANIGWDDGTRTDDARAYLRRVLAATWALSRQPLARERDASWDESHDGLTPRAPGKAMRRRPPSPIRLVDVGAMPAEPAHASRPDPDDGNGKRRYSCRWIVSGHYRSQPVGPGRAQRRRIWIAPYIAGPEDKPLVIKPIVHIWRKH